MDPKRNFPRTYSPEIQQSKGLLRFCQEFDRLLIEEEGQNYATTNLLTN